MNSQQELLDAINTISQSKDRSCDTPATVLRVEGDTVWVHIDGGADETPVQKTINCEQGETVQVRISNGNAFLVGNASAPPTDDKTAKVAHFVAEQAEIEAATAQNKAIEAQATAEAAQAAVAQSLTTYETWYLLSATTPTQPTEDSHTGWSTTEPAWSSSSTDNLYFSVRTVTGDGTITWSAVGMVQSYADLQILKNAIISTVASDYVAQGSSNVTSLSSTMLQNVNGVNIYNDTLAVGDSYAHIDGNSFDIRQATTAGTIDDANDTMLASFGQEVTVGTRYKYGVVGNYSQVYGSNCTASGEYSHAEGRATDATGECSHAEGTSTEASGDYSHAEGKRTEASGDYSHAEGTGSVASGECSHAEGGGQTTASALCSHAEGLGTTASGIYSHAEGQATEATGNSSHAEGQATEASGRYSHAEGYGSTASGDYSHAQNKNTVADSEAQTAIGKYNISDANNTYALIIGNGTSNARSDALRVKWDGSVIDGDGNKISPTILTSSTISAATTSYTFTNNAITADSTIEVFDEIDGFEYTTCSASAGSCTITFPAQSTSHKIKLHVF